MARCLHQEVRWVAVPTRRFQRPETTRTCVLGCNYVCQLPLDFRSGRKVVALRLMQYSLCHIDDNRCHQGSIISAVDCSARHTFSHEPSWSGSCSSESFFFLLPFLGGMLYLIRPIAAQHTGRRINMIRLLLQPQDRSADRPSDRLQLPSFVW